MPADGFDLALSIGGAAGQGIATPGNMLARIIPLGQIERSDRCHRDGAIPRRSWLGSLAIFPTRAKLYRARSIGQVGG